VFKFLPAVRAYSGLQAVGAALLSCAAFTVAAGLGLAVAGLFSLGFGVALEAASRKPVAGGESWVSST
jgi:hypothetical protein